MSKVFVGDKVTSASEWFECCSARFQLVEGPIVKAYCVVLAICRVGFPGLKIGMHTYILSSGETLSLFERTTGNVPATTPEPSLAGRNVTNSGFQAFSW